MPAKRRRAKRRTDPAAELAAWSDWFTCGHDFFGEAREMIGINPYEGTGCAVRQEATEAFLDAARDAWQRLGPMFMETWQPAPPHDTPHALKLFGAP